MKYNILLDKSYKFAIRSTRLYQKLLRVNKEYVLSKQFVRAANSIGANVEEAVGALTKKEFIAKMSIAYREARESHYWIRLLADTDYIDADTRESMLFDCTELLKIMTAILKTSKSSS